MADKISLKHRISNFSKFEEKDQFCCEKGIVGAFKYTILNFNI
jgi:hypothetical protein